MWFKVDDKLHDHRKTRAAGPAAMGLWVLAGSWSADNLTDGFVPATIATRWGRQREANRLIEVGLWHADEEDGERGYRFHEWLERQPSRAQKLEERAIRAEAGRTGGLQSGRSRREAKSKQGASGLVEPPSRPVPTRPTDAYASVQEAPDRFDEFWDSYSHKVGRKKAESAYRAALKKPGVTEDLLISSAAAYVTFQVSIGKHPEFTKHPATWLNGEHWRDERVAPRPQVGRAGQWLQLAESLGEPDSTDLRQIGPA